MQKKNVIFCSIFFIIVYRKSNFMNCTYISLFVCCKNNEKYAQNFCLAKILVVFAFFFLTPIAYNY